jgi:hypothetical protein
MYVVNEFKGNARIFFGNMQEKGRKSAGVCMKWRAGGIFSSVFSQRRLLHVLLHYKLFCGAIYIICGAI